MKKYLLLLVTILALSACDDQSEQSDGYATKGFMGGASASREMVAMAPAPSADFASLQSAPPSSMVLDRKTIGNRKIAETHSLSIETPYDVLEKRYQRDYAQCVKMGCQVINSNVQRESGGNIQARIAPDKLGAFLDFLATGDGEIKSHQVSADDYTMEYSDVSVTLKNLDNLHTRMTTLLGRAESVEDVLRVEQELNRIQTQIDQNTARLRILETMTSMATINLSYSVQYRPAEIQPYELNNTWKRTVNNFMRAIDHMIQFVGTSLPWIPVIFVGFWLSVRMLRFAFGKIAVRLPWRKSAN